MAIEVEMRAFVSLAQYNAVADWLRNKGWDGKTVRQVTFYLEADADTRIEIMKDRGSMRQKRGLIHEVGREELEIDLSRRQAEVILEIFKNVGLQLRAVWFRERAQFIWGDMKICLDNTLGYNRILEIEKIVPESEKVNAAKESLQETMRDFGLSPTPIEDQNAAYQDYLAQWREKSEGLTVAWVDS